MLGMCKECQEETLPNSAADMLPQKLTDVAELGFIRSCAVFRPVPLVHFWLVGSAPLVEPMIGPCVDGKARSAALFDLSGDHLSATSQLVLSRRVRQRVPMLEQ